ncbi:hypothetical protein D3C76_1375790 [compost metagenome]
MGGQHQARLQQFRDHGSGASGTQFVALAVVAGAHQDLHLGMTLAGGFQHAQGDVGLVHRNHQQARALKADGAEQFAAA